jgi:hypothetical protein
MYSHSDWLEIHTKSILVDTTITILGLTNDDEVPISLKIKAVELDYGPVIDFQIISSVPFTNMVEWSDHPLMCSTEYTEDGIVANIIDDTPVIRAMIMELVSPEKRTLHATTECTYKARLIKAIASFWS